MKKHLYPPSFSVLSVLPEHKITAYLKNLFLKFSSLLQGSDKSNDWMGREDEPLKGFSWRGGIEQNTMGILMWSKPFIMTLPSTGEEVRSQQKRAELASFPGSPGFNLVGQVPKLKTLDRTLVPDMNSNIVS